METDEGSRHVLPFQLQFDKPLASQMAEWNPEKDLLAMVTEDSKVVLHRFNWQRLWTISPGLDSSPQEEFLSLLGGARTSPAVHQFLVNSLGEVGMKRVSKVVCGAGKELQLVVLNHLQPAVEIIGFRIGELRGLSRWRSRYLGIGLDETLVDNAVEKAGMLLVQVERFIRVVSSVVQQFANFFSWLLKCIKQLMSEPSDQLLMYNSELVVVFLKFLYDRDPVMQLLDLSEADEEIDIDFHQVDCLALPCTESFQYKWLVYSLKVNFFPVISVDINFTWAEM
ncbi:hypothetical protein EUGRSUZ_C00026 [Eucalyptus grandis]|uniref:Uncharacterized protein n=1 Tax=Eucalyptus grandis TaxID=71139 RepID=A0ACC3L9Y7_EUCGR|nr:hypothetical protein EUGRSUZ_C00026 [Eucalyptus grandis]